MRKANAREKCSLDSNAYDSVWLWNVDFNWVWFIDWNSDFIWDLFDNFIWFRNMDWNFYLFFPAQKIRKLSVFLLPAQQQQKIASEN